MPPASTEGARTIAVVDDEPHIRETVAFALRREGYDVVEHPDGLTAWNAFDRRLPDLVVLDILMPGMDGLELCRRLRAKSQALPIVFVTSKDDELDRVLGLELGADDYLCKPFSLRELVARVRVLLRRLALLESPPAKEDDDKILRRGALVLDLQRYSASWNGAPVQLTVTEFLLLKALAAPPGPRQDAAAAHGGGLRRGRVRQRAHDRQPHQEAAPEVSGPDARLRRDPDRPRTWLPIPRSRGRQRVRIFTGIRPRLLAFNLLLVFLPLFGFLYLDVYENRLLRAQERSMVQQARLLAAALSTATPADAQSAQNLIESLQGRLDARLRVVDSEGNLLADSSRISPPPDDSRAADDDATSGRKPTREKLLYRVGAWFYRIYARIFEPPTPTLESAEFYGAARRLDGPEIQAALDGKYGSATRVSASGQRSVTLYSAVPFRRDGRIAGAVLVSQSTYRILQDLYAVRLGLFKVILLSVVVAALLSFLVAATIARPLRHLRDEAEAILDHRGRLTGGFQGSRRPDQIGDLARALQELTRRLDARMKTLETFAADVSHELRNPLTSIRTAAEMAAEVDDPAERGRFRDIVQRDIARVERLLAGVRDIASIDARLDQEEKENVRLDGLLKEIVASFNVRERGRVRFRLETVAAGVTVRGSTDRVSQIVENLLDNAAGFSPDGGEVVIHLDRHDSTAIIRVCDQGPGIPIQHLGRVFERFFTYRPDTAGGPQRLRLP